MNTITIQITAATEGGWSASVVTVESLTGRASVAGAPDVCSGRKEMIKAWIGGKVDLLKGLDLMLSDDVPGTEGARAMAAQLGNVSRVEEPEANVRSLKDRAARAVGFK